MVAISEFNPPFASIIVSKYFQRLFVLFDVIQCLYYALYFLLLLLWISILTSKLFCFSTLILTPFLRSESLFFKYIPCVISLNSIEHIYKACVYLFSFAYCSLTLNCFRVKNRFCLLPICMFSKWITFYYRATQGKHSKIIHEEMLTV